MTDFENWVAARWIGQNGVDLVTRRMDQMAAPDYRDCPEPWRTLFVVTTGFAGETGEVIEHVKKLVRDGKLDREKLLHELGDQHHYFVVLCQLFGFSLRQVENANVRKLNARDAAKAAA